MNATSLARVATEREEDSKEFKVHIIEIYGSQAESMEQLAWLLLEPVTSVEVQSLLAGNILFFMKTLLVKLGIAHVDERWGLS